MEYLGKIVLKRLFFRFVLKIHALTTARREREMCPEDENENEKTPGPLLLVTRSSESEEDESFDLVWQRKLARRAEEKAEREKKRREKLERKLVKQSEENERLRWEVARAKRAMRTMAREIEKLGNSDDEKEEEESKNRHIKLRRGDFKRYGYTEECAGCVRMRRGAKPPYRHNDRCRKRMEKSIKRDDAERWERYQVRRGREILLAVLLPVQRTTRTKRAGRPSEYVLALLRVRRKGSVQERPHLMNTVSRW